MLKEPVGLRKNVEVRGPYVTLVVNEYGDVVRFNLDSSRGDGQATFWASVKNWAFHLHRVFTGDPEEIPMKIASIGSMIRYNPNMRYARLFCPECGFTVVVPEDGMSTQELLDYFQQWNPQ